MRWAGSVLALVLVAGCVHTPPVVVVAPLASDPVDGETLALFMAGCRWTWFEEMGDAIDQYALLDCMTRAVAGETVGEWRSVVRARPDYGERGRANHYGRAPTLGLRGS